MEMKPVKNSSNVHSRGYDETTRKMRIRFTNGALYEYDDVSPDLVAEFDAAPKKGAFPRTRLYGKPYRKVE